MAIKEMSLEERYRILLDETQLIWLTNYAFNKEQGTLDKWLDNYIEVQKRMLRRDLGFAKLLKKIAPGRVFKQMTEQVVYLLQRYMPLSHIELSLTSENEAILKIENCPLLKRYKELIKQANLDLDPKFVCDNDLKIYPIIAKELGIDLTYELEETGCRLVGKLK
jgi:hypothetical protein